MTVEGVKHSPILSALFRTTADDSESELLGSAELIRGTRDHMKNTAKIHTLSLETYIITCKIHA